MTEPLTEEERQAMRQHPFTSSRVVRLLDLLEQAERNVESLAERLEASEQDCVNWAERLEQSEQARRQAIVAGGKLIQKCDALAERLEQAERERDAMSYADELSKLLAIEQVIEDNARLAERLERSEARAAADAEYWRGLVQKAADRSAGVESGTEEP